MAYIEISLKRTATHDLDAFNQRMRELDEVVECVMVAGGFDYLIKIRTENMQTYRSFLGEKLAAIEGVAQTHTYAVMEEVKSTHIIPVIKWTTNYCVVFISRCFINSGILVFLFCAKSKNTIKPSPSVTMRSNFSL